MWAAVVGATIMGGARSLSVWPFVPPSLVGHVRGGFGSVGGWWSVVDPWSVVGPWLGGDRRWVTVGRQAIDGRQAIIGWLVTVGRLVIADPLPTLGW